MRGMRSVLLIAIVAGVAVLVTGCYEQRPRYFIGVPLPMSMQEVIAAAKAGQPEEQIISNLGRSGSVFRLTVEDVDRLREEGVPENVINFMLSTPARAVAVIEEPPLVYEAVPVSPPPVVVYRPAPVVIYRRLPPPPVRFHFGFGYHYHRWH